LRATIGTQKYFEAEIFLRWTFSLCPARVPRPAFGWEPPASAGGAGLQSSKKGFALNGLLSPALFFFARGN